MADIELGLTSTSLGGGVYIMGSGRHRRGSPGFGSVRHL